MQNFRGLQNFLLVLKTNGDFIEKQTKCKWGKSSLFFFSPLLFVAFLFSFRQNKIIAQPQSYITDTVSIHIQTRGGVHRLHLAIII
jgi:hypothetical protein